MKKTLLWIVGILLSPLLLFVLLTALLYVPVVQNWAVDKVASVASDATGMHISVNHVDLDFPLDLGVDGVLVVRPERDTVADIGRVVADVRLWPLLHSRVEVDELTLEQARVNTFDFLSDLQVRGTVGRLSVSAHDISLNDGTVQLNNAQLHDADVTVLLSDTAAVDTTTSETPWLISVDSVTVSNTWVRVSMPGDSMRVAALLGKASVKEGRFDLLHGLYTVRSVDWREGALGYDKTFEPRAATGFDYNHIALTDVGIGLDSVFFSSPNLALSIRDAAFREQSGLQLASLTGTVLMDSAGLRLPLLQLTTPYSYICTRARMDFSVMDEQNPGQLHLDLQAQLGRQDIMLMAPDLPEPMPARWPQWPLTVNASVDGNAQQARISQLELSLPTAFHATASGTVGRLTSLERLLAQLDVQVETYDLGFVTAAFLDRQQQADYRLPNGLRLGGKLSADGSRYVADLTARQGGGSVALRGWLNQQAMSYDADVDIRALNLHNFMPNDSLHELSAHAHVKGQGTDFFRRDSWLEAEASVEHLRYGQLNVDSIDLNARLRDGHVLATVTGENSWLQGSLTADALMDSNRLRATIGADLRRLDLRTMQLVEDPLAIGMCGHIDVNSNLADRHSVSGLIGDFYIADSLNTYRPEDVGLTLRTQPDTTLLRLQSGDLILKADAQGGYEQLLGQLTTLADTLTSQFSLKSINQGSIKPLLPRVRLYATSGRNNPIANFLRSSSAIDFKELLVDVTSSPEKGLNGDAHLFSLNADSTRIDTIRLHLRDTEHGLTYQGQVANNRKNPQFVFNALLDGQVHEKGANIGVRYYDEKGQMGLRLGATADMQDNGVRFRLLPARPTIGYREFSLNDDNFLLLRNDMKLQAKVDLIADDGTGVKIYSENQDSTLLQDLTVSLYRFDLDKLTSVLPYMPRITGTLDGDYHLMMNEQKQISVASDMQVAGMTYESSPIGNIDTEFVYMQREDDTHAIEAVLKLENKEVASLRGSYQNQGDGNLDATLALQKMPMSLVNGFVPDHLLGLEGYAEGDMTVKGSTRRPQVDGEVYLDSAALISVPYGVRLRFDDDPVRVINSQLLLENFTMYAYNDEPLNIMGNIDFHDTERITMDVRMRARNFQLINSKQTKESVAYGTAFVNFFARMSGRMDQLRMRGKLDVLGTTDLTYILLDSPLSTDNQLDELVKFADFSDSIQTVVNRPTPDGLDVDMSISIDQGAHVRCDLNVDQTNYVDLFGGGDLRMKYGNDGVTMTGRYTVQSGEMKYSLPVIPLKTFTIQDGSYVEFTGDPMNPRLNLTATERTKASVASEGEASRSVTFDCGVVITKTLADMGLEFIISAPEDMAVSSELGTMTTEQRGKLAVTMLTTGMYLANGNTSGFSMNSALSSFLQSEINNITGNALKTLDLSVGLDNTTDASGRMHTDYSFKFAKRFWNNRLNVQIGGKVSTGTEVQGQNQSFFDNVTMEYRLSPTSNQYVKLFYNQNVYDWLEGYTGEYGGGYIWKRKLDSFWDILKIWGSEKRNVPQLPTRRQSLPAGEGSGQARDRQVISSDSITNEQTISNSNE